jgi:hypothetical protein
MTEAFKTYQKAGISCLPTKPDKSPYKPWKEGITDLQSYTNAHGIGLICGKISGNLECMDFDNHFGDAKDTLSQFIAIPEIKEIYEKYKLPIESTVSGGFHLLYRCDKIEGNQKLASRPKKVNDKWRPDTIIETRGEGGYFCADPTPGYKVIRNSILDIQCITEIERYTLISFAKSFNEWNDSRPNEFETDEKPGNIYNSKSEAIQEMKDALTDEGWKELANGMWQRPGKDKGISASIGKVAPHVFYNWSANGYPFNENSGYTPFQVVGLLKYKGDFKAFAKELADIYCEKKETKEYKKTDKPDPKKIDIQNILDKAYIDLRIPVSKPPIVMRIRDIENGNVIDRRLFTLGNFSCTTGKSKSKKTFLSSLFLASASMVGVLQSKFVSDFPDSKTFVTLFDTEQSRYDSYVTSLRVPQLLGFYPDNFASYDLREYTALERCDIIDQTLEKLKGSLGFIVIDGIADLANAINDEIEASRVVSLLMRWTKIYNCHIHVIIHENKGDNNATGHLGSSILKKAETIISVTKDPDDFRKSIVKCTLIRGTMDFNDFVINVDEDGLPKVEQGTVWNKPYNEIKERAF